MSTEHPTREPATDPHRPTPTIRRANLDDLLSLAELSEKTFRDTFAADNTPDDLEAYVAESFAPSVLKAELEGPASTFLLAFADTDAPPIGYAKLRSGPSTSAGRRRGAISGPLLLLADARHHPPRPQGEHGDEQGDERSHTATPEGHERLDSRRSRGVMHPSTDPSPTTRSARVRSGSQGKGGDPGWGRWSRNQVVPVWRAS